MIRSSGQIIVSLDQELAIATSAGRILRLIADEMKIPTVGRAAAGNIALRLGNSETQIGVSVLDLQNHPNSELILITAEGFAKRISAASIRSAVRGEIGSQCFKFQSRADELVSMTAIANPRLDLPVTFLIGQDNDIYEQLSKWTKEVLKSKNEKRDAPFLIFRRKECLMAF
jgi:DNA gyrase subunit A